jgi:hypothetical protein
MAENGKKTTGAGKNSFGSIYKPRAKPIKI